MEWRESLDGACGLADVERLAASVAAHRSDALAELKTLIDDQHNYPSAAQQVRALMFVERFASDVDARLEALEN
jgi:molecular chaperone HscB